MTILLCRFACNALAKNAVWVSVPHSSLRCALRTTVELGGILATVPPHHCCMGNSKNKEEKIFYRLVASMQQLSEWQRWTEAVELLCSQVGQDNPPSPGDKAPHRSITPVTSQPGRQGTKGNIFPAGKWRMGQGERQAMPNTLSWLFVVHMNNRMDWIFATHSVAPNSSSERRRGSTLKLRLCAQ